MCGEDCRSGPRLPVGAGNDGFVMPDVIGHPSLFVMPDVIGHLMLPAGAIW